MNTITENNWKFRNNDISNLTKQQLIENTIKEEVFLCSESCHLWFPATGEETERCEQEGYDRAIAILNEVM